MFILATY